jgi:hypothetical protein
VPDTWYRGEGAGVPPSKAGAWTHDLGDGLYLTDTEDVAWMYAKLRAPGYKEYRVYQVDLERSSLGRVLDLTADFRWERFMNEPMFAKVKNLPGTRMGLYRRQNNLYGEFFEEFLRLNKIDINSYDAVIGPEYQRGGKQLCILHKRGLASRLSMRIRDLLIPEEWAARLSAVASRWEKLSFPRAVGGIIVNIAIALVLGYIVSKVMDYIEDKLIKQQMQMLEPEIQNFRAARQIVVLDNLVAGEHAYVTATFEISRPQMTVDNMGIGNPELHSSLPLVKLDSLWISSKDLTDAKPRRDWETIAGISYDIVEFNSSAEATAPAEEVLNYRDVQDQLAWYETALKNRALTDSDRARLKKEEEALREWIDETYGKLDDFKPTRHLWTKEGYARAWGAR